MEELLQQVASYATPAWCFPILLALLVFAFVAYYLHCVTPRRGTLEWVQIAAKPSIRFVEKRRRCDKTDAVCALMITVLYACTAFFQLGVTTNPQTFYEFERNETITLRFETPVDVNEIFFYTGLYVGEYAVFGFDTQEEIFSLGTMEQPHSKLFHWRTLTVTQPAQQLYAITITAQKQLALGEVVVYDASGAPLAFTSEAGTIYDEPEVVPAQSHWTNSTYFDEIYHARTAYEHITNVYPYEVTHPPLGKLLISVGIRLFGMTPFGWRFVGTLLGVLMVPIFYAFLKNLFGKRKIACIGTVLLSTSFMHLTQTRIATIDTYAVFFVLLMYYFMYRYLTLPQQASMSKQMLELGLSGLFFGIGVACKWTVIYGGVGLALLYFIGMYFRLRDWDRGADGARSAVPWCIGTLLMSVLFFIVIPLTIYTLSYLPYLWASDGRKTLLQIVWDNQVSMFKYHSDVTETHPYQSPWWKWIFDVRPILYYLDNSQVETLGVKTAFAAFNNPLISWLGLFAVVLCAVRMVRAKSARALFIVVGYLSQLVPWMPITRPTFAYHYFPSIPFLILAICYLLDEMVELRGEEQYRIGYGVAGLSTGLYAAFYPVLIGLEVPVWYTTNFLQWFPSWPF